MVLDVVPPIRVRDVLNLITYALNWWGFQPSLGGFQTERDHAAYWYTYDENTNLAVIAVMDSIIDLYFPDGEPGADKTIPMPNVMTWEIPPAAPVDGGDWQTEIVMTATTAIDENGVEYYFEELSGNPGGADSGWQDSPFYRNTSLTPGLQYTYKVTVRDKSSYHNMTEPSIAVTFTAGLACSTCGDLDGSGGSVDLADFAEMAKCWGKDPMVNSDCLCANIIEFGKSKIDLLDLRAFAELFISISPFYPSHCLTSVTDPYAPTPEMIEFATAPYETSATSAAMVAETASDPSGVEYYFTCISGGGHDSGWQDSNMYEDMGLIPETIYAYTVKARDKSVNQNVTTESVEGEVTLPFDGIFVKNADSLLTLDNSDTFELALNLSYGGAEITQDGIIFTSVDHESGLLSTVFGSANGITVTGECDSRGFAQSALGDDELWYTDTFTPSQGAITLNITGLDSAKKYRIQILNGEPRIGTLYNNGTISVTDSSDNVQTSKLSFGDPAGKYALTTISISSITSVSYYIPRAGRGPSIAGVIIHSVD